MVVLLQLLEAHSLGMRVALKLCCSFYYERCFLENSIFVPCPKQVVLTKNSENDDFTFYPQKQGFCSSDLETDKK